MARWPETAVVFREYAVACIGCAVAPFCSISDAAHDYGVSVATLSAQLRQIIASQESLSEEDGT